MLGESLKVTEGRRASKIAAHPRKCSLNAIWENLISTAVEFSGKFGS